MFSTTFLILFLILAPSAVRMKKHGSNLMCYYDHNAYTRKVLFWFSRLIFCYPGIGQMSMKDVEHAMPMCTHVIYGYVGINKKYGLASLNSKVDLAPGLNYLKHLPYLKTYFPDKKFYLSIGGDIDVYHSERYLRVLNSIERRSQLIASIIKVAVKYNFEGIDLAWQFPKERRKCNSTLPNQFKGCFNFECAAILEKDPKNDAVDAFYVNRLSSKQNFTLFLRELWKECHSSNLSIMLTVLPYVNVEFFEVKNIKPYVEFVHLMAYDYENPYYSPKETYYWSIFRFQDNTCNPNRNYLTIENQVRSWVVKGMKREQIILGVPAYGRTWRIRTGGYDGPIKAPIKADGVGAAGKYTRKAGLLAYYEICELFQNSTNVQLKEYILSLGTAAFKAPTRKQDGIWLAYDNLQYIMERVKFTKDLKLAGLAIMDLSLDDFRGICQDEIFPILRTIKKDL